MRVPTSRQACHESGQRCNGASRRNKLGLMQPSPVRDPRHRPTGLTTTNSPLRQSWTLDSKGHPGGSLTADSPTGLVQCAGSKGMVTARLSPGATNMSGEAGKRPFRRQNTTPIVPRTNQSPYVAPRLATSSTRDERQEARVVSPRIQQAEDNTISPNVTPRSAIRQSRPATTSIYSTPETTPLATPASSRAASVVSPSVRSRNLRAERPRPSFVRAPTEPKDVTSQFFHASDGPAAAQRAKSPAASSRASYFIYANGEEDSSLDTRRRESRRTSRSPGPLPSEYSSQRKQLSSRSSSTMLHRPKTASAVYPSSRTHSPPTGDPTPFAPFSVLTQDQSTHIPPEEGGTGLRAAPDLRILSRTIRGAAPRSRSPLKKFDVGALTSPPHPRRASTTEAPILNPILNPILADWERAQRSELTGVTTNAMTPVKVPPVQMPPVQVTPVQMPPVQVPPSFAVPMSPESPTRPLVPTNAPLYSVPGSPTKRDSREFPTTAVDARRERKILDLEISNHSLLTFNRSLEKEIRKLKGEVRRHRRITSQSAFSEVSTSSILSHDHMRDDIPEEEELSECEQSDTASTLSEGRAAEQKARDERRLQRDFAKHKQLLNDSREMNLSIKRCMDSTTLMIAEAKKALAQDINLDGDLGGRVLQQDDAGIGSARGLLGSIIEADLS